MRSRTLSFRLLSRPQIKLAFFVAIVGVMLTVLGVGTEFWVELAPPKGFYSNQVRHPSARQRSSDTRQKKHLTSFDRLASRLIMGCGRAAPRPCGWLILIQRGRAAGLRSCPEVPHTPAEEGGGEGGSV